MVDIHYRRKELQKLFQIKDLSRTSIQNFISSNLKKKILVDTRIFSRSFILELINSSKKSNTKIIHDKKYNRLDLEGQTKTSKRPFFF